MIIGIDASRANLQHKTGTEWYSFHLIKNLAEIDHENTYRLYLNKPPRLDLIDAVKDNPNFHFQLLAWPFHSFWTLGRLTWEMLWRRPDVLFIPAHGLPLVGPRKTLNTIHDVAFLREQNLYRSVKVKTDLITSRKIINFLVRTLTLGRYRSESVDYLHWSTAFALRHAKKIIAVSEFTKKEILELCPKTPADQIAVIHNGYNDKLYQPVTDPEKIREALARHDLNSPYLLYIGRLEKKKNTAALVEAYALWREEHPGVDIKLLLVGDAGFGYDEVKYIIQEYNLDRQVLMPGWISEEDMPYIYCGASAFIFPSKHEGFGIPILQALGCGVPTAASDLPVLREVAGEAVRYFNQNDRRSIAAAMSDVLSNDELRERLRKEGVKRAQAFSWRKCANETLEVIKSL